MQTGSQKFAIVHDADVRDCSFLSNGLIVTLTWCLLSVYNTRGRQLSRWTDRDGNVNFCNLSCAQGKDGYYIAVQGSTGSITVSIMGVVNLDAITFVFGIEQKVCINKT